MNRRGLLKATIGSLALLSLSGLRTLAQKLRLVSDYSGLTEIEVAAELHPTETSEVGSAVAKWAGPISIGGGRFSMGGQVASANSLHLDMRSMNRIIKIDSETQTARVQAGVTWRDLQEAIDKFDMSVSIMQSYSNFTVGGSVSVNCHGRYLGKGPIINSVRALQLVLSNGEVLELTPVDELFCAVVGGYGGLGVITEVELSLDRNQRIRRVVEKVDLSDYPSYFHSNIEKKPEILLHNADLRPPGFNKPRMVSWTVTNDETTVPERLIPHDLKYRANPFVLWAVSEIPGGKMLRRGIEDKIYEEDVVVWRNYEASLDTDSLEPANRRFSTYLLQEYFIPVEKFEQFVESITSILKKHRVNALNISVRHSPRDTKSLLSWAPVDVFSFVLYYKQGRSKRAHRAVEKWTQEAIDLVLANSGRYYLPYRLHASQDQFERAYPESKQFIELKRKFDPTAKFSNLLWDKYLT